MFVINRCEGRIVIDRFFTKVFKLINELVDTFLGLLTLGHFSAHTFLSKTTGLTEGLAETLFSAKLLDRGAIFAHELSSRILLESFHVTKHLFNFSLLLLFRL